MSRLLFQLALVVLVAAVLRAGASEPAPVAPGPAPASKPHQTASRAAKPAAAAPSPVASAPVSAQPPATIRPASREAVGSRPTVAAAGVHKASRQQTRPASPRSRSRGLIESLGGAPATTRPLPAKSSAPQSVTSHRRLPAPASGVVELPLSGNLGGDPVSSGQPAAAPGASAPSDALARRIIALALAEQGRVDYSKRGLGGPHGWSHLQNLIADATGQRPTDAEMQRTWKPHGISWCGVWAIWVYRQAGVEVAWQLTRGGPEGAIEKRWPWDFSNRAGFEAAVRPGDIVVGPGPLWHQSIVVGVGTDGSLDTVSGNTVFGRIVRRSSPHLSQVTAILRPRIPTQEH